MPDLKLTVSAQISTGPALDLHGDNDELTIEISGAVGSDDAVLTILSAGDVTP